MADASTASHWRSQFDSIGAHSTQLIAMEHARLSNAEPAGKFFEMLE
jgi:hypothetical protein